MRLILSLLLLLLGQCFLHGQDSLLIVQADDVEISASRIPVSLFRAPFAVQKLKINQVSNANQNFSVNEYLGELPGIFALNQYNSAQDLRVSIRGFGSRAAFGIRGIKIMMDGIPLSTPDGQGQVDNIFVGGLRALEVLNGASSALYGNASGGVISLTTFQDSEKDNNLISLGYGSFGALQTSLTSHLVRGKSKIDNQLSYSSSTGFRDHSETSNIIYNGRFLTELKHKQELSFILNIANSPKGQDPGGITIEDVAQQRNSARSRNVDFLAGEEVVQATGGIKYLLPLNQNTKINALGYYTVRDFENRLPFENGGQVDLLRNYGGGSVHLSHSFMVNELDNEVIAGIDIAYQNDRRKRFLNLLGDRGAETLNQNEIFSNQGAFVSLRSRYQRLLSTASLRYDRNLISVKDRFEADGIADGELALPSLSPAISASYNVYKYYFLSASFSYGFETPTLSELSSRPDNLGGLNSALKPQQSYNYEIGYKAIMSDAFKITAAVFLINSKDELLPYEIEEFSGRTFYRNAGTTSRQGIEISTELRVLKKLDLNLAYTYSDFTFTDGDDFIGNTLPGIPKHNFSGSLTYESEVWSVRYSSRLYSEIYANSSNMTEIPAYHLGAISISRKVGALRPYIGINNLYNNTDYYDNIRINAFGGRYYEAGPPRNFYLGLKFEF